MHAYSSHPLVASAIIAGIMLSFGQHGSFAFPLSRGSREFLVRCDLHSLPGYAGWDFKSRVANAKCGGWCPADDLVFEPGSSPSSSSSSSSSSPPSCVPIATRTVFKFFKQEATYLGGKNRRQPSNPWGLPNPNPNPTTASASKEPSNPWGLPNPDPTTASPGVSVFDAEEHCNRAADRCMAIDDNAEACDAFKPCIDLWMLAGRLKFLKVPTACGCAIPEEEKDDNDCNDEWICEKTDFTTCRCFEPEGSEEDVNAGCAAQNDHTGDAVCGWNADTEQCSGCPMLPEGDCKSSANPNCEWKKTVCGVVDAASHTSPPFDSDGNKCV